MRTIRRKYGTGWCPACGKSKKSNDILIYKDMYSKKLELDYKGHSLQIDCLCRRAGTETVVYLHGLGCSKNDFLEAFHRAELNGYTLVAFDFPGCGDSPYPKTITLEMDDLVEITHLILSKLQIDEFVIVGHSMGGLVALLHAERYKKHVKGFVNVEGNLAPEDCFFSREVTQHSFNYFTTTSLPELKRRLRHSPNKGFRKYAETLEIASERAFFDYSPSLVEYSDSGSLVQRFIGLRTPKLFVYGSENRTLSYLPLLKGRGCETVEIPQSNHFSGYDNPEAFYRALAAFLQMTR